MGRCSNQVGKRDSTNRSTSANPWHARQRLLRIAPPLTHVVESVGVVACILLQLLPLPRHLTLQRLQLRQQRAPLVLHPEREWCAGRWQSERMQHKLPQAAALGVQSKNRRGAGHSRCPPCPLGSAPAASAAHPAPLAAPAGSTGLQFSMGIVSWQASHHPATHQPNPSAASHRTAV